MNGPDDPRRHFAERIIQLRDERGLSTDVLAARAKIDPVELEAILQDQGQVGVDKIFLLAGALGVGPGELLEGIAWVPDGSGDGEYRIEDSEED